MFLEPFHICRAITQVLILGDTLIDPYTPQVLSHPFMMQYLWQRKYIIKEDEHLRVSDRGKKYVQRHFTSCITEEHIGKIEGAFISCLDLKHLPAVLTCTNNILRRVAQLRVKELESGIDEAYIRYALSYK